jgi:hypothetical protein
VKLECGQAGSLKWLSEAQKGMELIRTSTIKLTWDGDKICALAGDDLQGGIVGFGNLTGNFWRQSRNYNE